MPSGVPATWDILIPTIPHRHEKLCGLLAELDRQWRPGLGVRIYRDNFELVHLDSHAKRQALMEASAADYISHLDDDDWVAEDFVAVIMQALEQRPDYVGFHVEITWDGRPHRTAVHSLEYASWNGWEDEPKDQPLVRNVTHLNPIRRELALLGQWTGSTDEQWSQQVWESGKVVSQVMIRRDMYFYRFSPADSFVTQRCPATLPLPDLPEYPWLTIV